MQITLNHSASLFGVPVILADDGGVMESAPGVRAVRRALSLSTTALAAHCGVSRRSVEAWEQGRPVPCSALNVMAGLLAK